MEDPSDYLRNITCDEMPATSSVKYTDIRIDSSYGDFFMGHSNGEITAITGIHHKQVSLMPIKKNSDTRFTAADSYFNMAKGGRVLSLRFSPFDKNIFAALSEDGSGAQQEGVSLIVARYNSDNKDDYKLLNQTAEVTDQLFALHPRKGCDILWSHVVENVIYTSALNEIAMCLVEGGEINREFGAKFILSPNNMANVSNFCLSYDGRYLISVWIASGSNRKNEIAIFRTDYDAIDQSDGNVEPILRFECGGGPGPKIASLLSGRIVLSRMDVGKRLIELINWDAEKKSHEILCTTETQGSIPAKLVASKSGEYFFSHGKGDMVLNVYGIDKDDQINCLGSSSSASKPVTGVLFFEETQVDVNSFEMIRLMVSHQYGTKSKLSLHRFFLPRRGDPKKFNCYFSIPYREPSATFMDWTKAGMTPIQIKTAHRLEQSDLISDMAGSSKKAKKTTFSFKSNHITSTQPKEQPKPASNVVDSEAYQKLLDEPVRVTRPSARGSTELKQLKEKVADLENRLVYLEKVVKQKDNETTKELLESDVDSYGSSG